MEDNEVMNDELQHHGTKGMKWGIRRWQNKDGSLTPAGKKRYDKQDSDDVHEDHLKPRAKSVRAMTDKELNDAIVRLQREKLYSDLTAPKVSKGRKIAEKALDRMVDKTIETAVNKVGSKVLDKAFDSAITKATNAVAKRFKKTNK